MTLKQILKTVFLGQRQHVGTTNDAKRDAWIENQLKSLPEGGRILDAGAGQRPYKKHCGHLKYVAQDFGKYDGSGDSKGLQVGSWDQTSLDIVCDILQIPEPDGSFDAILCTEVLEHLPDPRGAIREFGRLLKPGGRLIITAPFFSLTHFAPFHFATGFNHYFYDDVFKKNELSITEVTANGNYFESLAQELRRLPQIAEKYSKKKIRPATLASLGLLLRSLDKFSELDEGSQELLCYGYFVIGEKNSFNN